MDIRVALHRPISRTLPPDVSPKPSTNRATPARIPNLRPRVSSAPDRLHELAHEPPPRIRGRALQRIRRQHLQQNPLCVKCYDRDRIVAATQIDHKTPLWAGGADDADNRQGLCDACHLEKSTTEAALRAAGGSLL